MTVCITNICTKIKHLILFYLTLQLWPDLRNQKFPEGFCDSYRTEVRNSFLPSNKYWLDWVWFVILLCIFFSINSSRRCCPLHRRTGQMQKTSKKNLRCFSLWTRISWARKQFEIFVLNSESTQNNALPQSTSDIGFWWF